MVIVHYDFKLLEGVTFHVLRQGATLALVERPIARRQSIEIARLVQVLIDYTTIRPFCLALQVSIESALNQRLHRAVFGSDGVPGPW